MKKNNIFKLFLVLFVMSPFVCQDLKALISAEDSTDPNVRAGVEAFGNKKFWESHSLLEPAAKAGDAEAQYYMGLIYIDNYYGDGPDYWWNNVQDLRKTKNEKKRKEKMTATGIDWMRKSVWQDYVPALVYMGKRNLDKNKTQREQTEGLQWLQRAAKRNSDEAYYHLGYSYRWGYGVPRDMDLCLQHLEKAAGLGNVKAPMDLYDIYNNKYSTDIYNPEKALKWLDRAVLNKTPRAYEIMGQMYMDGEGGKPQNYEMAISWYEKADTPEAKRKLEKLYELRAEQELKKELERMTALQAYEKGKKLYEDNDYYKAFPYIKAGAEKGNQNSQFRLGYMYDMGQGVGKDYSEAKKWYEKAAAQGHAVSMNNLGVIYENGKGVTANETEALSWYKKAANKGNKKGKENFDNLTASISKRKQAEGKRRAEEKQRQAEAQKRAQQQSSSPKQSSGGDSGPRTWRVDMGAMGYTDFERKADGSIVSKTTGPCFICHGTGVCGICSGNGFTYNRALNTSFACASCLQSGRCKSCKGTGQYVTTTVSDGAGGHWTSGSDGNVVHSSQVGNRSSSSSSSSSSSRSSTSSGRSSVCDRCNGLGLDKSAIYVDDPGGAVSHTYGHVAYTHTDGSKCVYCGLYKYHVHLKCTKCGY